MATGYVYNKNADKQAKQTLKLNTKYNAKTKYAYKFIQSHYMEAIQKYGNNADLYK